MLYDSELRLSKLNSLPPLIIQGKRELVKYSDLQKNPFYVYTVSSFRSSRSQMFFKIRVLKNFARFTRKHLCWSLFLNTRNQIPGTEFTSRGPSNGTGCTESLYWRFYEIVQKQNKNFVNSMYKRIDKEKCLPMVKLYQTWIQRHPFLVV